MAPSLFSFYLFLSLATAAQAPISSPLRPPFLIRPRPIIGAWASSGPKTTNCPGLIPTKSCGRSAKTECLLPHRKAPGDTALPTLPPTHRFDFAGNQYLYVDIFIVHLQRSLLFPFELPFCHFHKNFSSFDLVPPRLKSIQIGRSEVFQRPLQPGIGPAIKSPVSQ